MSLRRTGRAVAVLLVFCTACGAAEDADPVANTVPPQGEAVPVAAANGLWLIERAEVGDERLTATTRGDFFVEIDTVISAVSVRSGCGLVVGSLTFQPNTPGETEGIASFSLPGRTATGDCTASESSAEDLVVEIMENVAAWSIDDDLESGERLDRLHFLDSTTTTQLTLRRG